MEKIKNSHEIMHEYKILIFDYLEAEDISDANTIKNFIIQKVTQELSPKDVSKLKSELTQMLGKEHGKRKMRIYELNAGLYNNTPLKQNHGGEYYHENIIPFEIAGVKTDSESKIQLTSQKITPLGNGRYQIDLAFSKQRGKWVNVISNTNILLEYKGGNVISILHPQFPEKIIGHIPIRNKREINIGGGRILEQNIFVTIPIKSSDKNIQIDLSFPNK